MPTTRSRPSRSRLLWAGGGPVVAALVLCTLGPGGRPVSPTAQELAAGSSVILPPAP